MLRPKIYITLSNGGTAKLDFDFASSVTTDESHEHLTDTATIVVPRKISMNGKNIFSGSGAIFKRGDAVKIEAGYHPNKEVIFEGFITKVGAKIPVEIECEDGMFLLKNTRIKFPVKETEKEVAANLPLQKLAELIIKGTDVKLGKIEDMKLGVQSFDDETPAEILEKLRDKFGLYAFFSNTKLNIVLENKPEERKTSSFPVEETVLDISKLAYQEADDIKVGVKLISTNADNKPVISEKGDKKGAVKTFYYSGFTDQAKLDDMAQKRLNQIKYTGFTGTLVTLGEPTMRHGDCAKITSTKLAESDGTYVIKSVKRSFTVNGGYRQTLELGEKIKQA